MVRDLTTVFEREPDEEIRRRKQDGGLPLARLGDDAPVVVSCYACPIEAEEAGDEEAGRRAAIALPLPRPAWSGLEAREVLKREEEFFSDWLAGVYLAHNRSRLNFFEHNFEVWRQIWRTTERADAFLMVIDSRMPLFHFSLSLYRFLAGRSEAEAGPGPGNIIVVLNKVDLIPPELVDLWMRYFGERFPGLPVVPFFVPKSGSARIEDTDSARELLEALRSRRVVKRIGGELRPMSAGDFFRPRRGQEETLEEEEQRFRHPGTLTVALMGDPNMGKSSVINAIFGRKVVSSSATPGHTKHFQTHFLPLARATSAAEEGAAAAGRRAAGGELLSNICFMDSPGIVVPKLDVPRAVQVVFGSYRIAQLREPYSVIRWLTEQGGVGLVGRFGLERYRTDESDKHDLAGTALAVEEPWTPLSVCEAFARRSSFFTKTGAPEPFRAANKILRDVLIGRGIVAAYLPPGFDAELDAMREAATRLVAERQSEPEEVEEEEEEDEVLDILGGGQDEDAEDEDDEDEEVDEQAPQGGSSRKKNAFQALLSDSEEEDEDEDDEDDDEE